MDGALTMNRIACVVTAVSLVALSNGTGCSSAGSAAAGPQVATSGVSQSVLWQVLPISARRVSDRVEIEWCICGSRDGEAVTSLSAAAVYLSQGGAWLTIQDKALAGVEARTSKADYVQEVPVFSESYFVNGTCVVFTASYGWPDGIDASSREYVSVKAVAGRELTNTMQQFKVVRAQVPVVEGGYVSK